MRRDREPAEPGLPATVTFVTVIGVFIAAGWILMFLLLLKRW